jgi:hypothetical protein
VIVRPGSERGQALVELVACLPVVALVALALAQGFLVLRAESAAESALERGRVAAARGDDPVAAARTGLADGAVVRREGARLWVALPVPRVLAGVPLPAAHATGDVVPTRGG